MIPSIFDSSAKTFTSNGLGKLTDCLSCLVTEERNGIYELVLEYPITGIHYEELVEGNIIVTTHDEQKDLQPFVIYRISRPISGVVVVNAHHVSYALANVVVSPFTALSVTDAFLQISTHSLNTNPFTFWTDKASAGSMEVKVPTPVKQVLGGKSGSVLDSFGGGEYKWDGYTVKLYADRGSDNGVTIRYGKNLTDITAERDTLGLYNAVIPYWTDSENTVVYGGIVVGSGGIAKTAHWTDESNVNITDENGDVFDFAYYAQQVTTMDLSSEFADQPTVQELENRARAILNSNHPWIPKDNIKIAFVALWQTEEYANIAPLERVQLCDTVSVYYPELGVDAKAKVIKVVWDALLDRYDSIELGEAQTSFAQVITAETSETIQENVSMMEAAIQHATELITGGLGGHIVFLYDADGKPTDMLVMDTEDVNTAVNVLRINVNGIGFSSSGVSGPYVSAWTLDGAFVADFITAGHISCNRIQGGTLTLGGNNNGNGVLVVYNSSGTEIGRWDNSGITASGNFTLSDSYGGQLYTGYIGSFNYYIVGLNSISSASGRGFSIQRPNYQYSIDISRDVAEYVLTTGATWSKTIFTGNDSSYSAYVFSLSNSTGFQLFSKESSVTTFPRLSVTLGSSSTTNKAYVYMPHGQLNIDNTEIILSRDYTGSQTTDLASNKPYMRLGSNTIRLNSTNSNVYFALGSSTANIYVSSSVYLRYSSSSWILGNTSASQTGNIAIQGSSARRYKHDITDKICDELDAHKLYGLTMKQFVFNDDCEKWQYPGMKGKTLPGFIAEDVEEIYPAAAIYDIDGQIESWDERRIIPGMLKLIQEQKELIDQQAERIANLEERLAKLEQMMGV